MINIVYVCLLGNYNIIFIIIIIIITIILIITGTSSIPANHDPLSQNNDIEDMKTMDNGTKDSKSIIDLTSGSSSSSHRSMIDNHVGGGKCSFAVRPDVHVLVVGDPGLGKVQYMSTLYS